MPSATARMPSRRRLPAPGGQGIPCATPSPSAPRRSAARPSPEAPPMADNTDPTSPDHDRADLPADLGGFAAQLHEAGTAWRDQTAADIARVSRRPRGLLPVAAMIGIIGLLAAVLHGLLAHSRIAPPPAGWQTPTPPPNEQFASYAASPDGSGSFVSST